jgi:hypothetical protein
MRCVCVFVCAFCEFVCARKVHTACALEEAIEASVNRHATLIVVIARIVLHAAPSLGFRV